MEKTCGHCGGSNALVRKGSVLLKRVEEAQGAVTVETYVDVSYCLACDEPLIYRLNWSDDVGESWGERLLYPTVRNNDSVPEKIRTRLEAAVRVKKIEPGLYAVGIRRMLETIAHEEGATVKDLFEKLDQLVENGRIPAPLAESAHELRKLGNLGAHDDEIDVEPSDVPAIEALTDAILEYLYRAPAALDAVKKSLSGRKPASQD